MSVIRNIRVRCRVPSNVSDEEIAAFVTEWLECGGGCRRSEDPLFNSLSVENVEIRNVKFVNSEPNVLPGDRKTK